MLQIRPVLAVAAIAGSLAFVAGCGGDDEEDTGGATQTGTGAQTTDTGTQTGADGGADTAAARDTFASTCGGCHVLADAGTNGQVGPNLDDLAPNEERVLTAIRTGPGAMPENLLQGEEAQAVAEYVSSVAGQ